MNGHEKHDDGLALASIDLGILVLILACESSRYHELRLVHFESFALMPTYLVMFRAKLANLFELLIRAKEVIKTSGKPGLHLALCVSKSRRANGRRILLRGHLGKELIKGIARLGLQERRSILWLLPHPLKQEQHLGWNDLAIQ